MLRRLQEYDQAHSTALLPGIQLDRPKRAICKNTVDAIRAGVMFSAADTLDGRIRRFEAELGEPATVIATGGSMVLYPEAMAHLKENSTVIWLQTPFSQLEKRMPADLYDRGIAVPAGTPLREIYEERCVLYARYADLIVASQDGEADTARLVEDVMRTVGLET